MLVPLVRFKETGFSMLFYINSSSGKTINITVLLYFTPLSLVQCNRDGMQTSSCLVQRTSFSASFLRIQPEKSLVRLELYYKISSKFLGPANYSF